MLRVEAGRARPARAVAALPLEGLEVERFAVVPTSARRDADMRPLEAGSGAARSRPALRVEARVLGFAEVTERLRVAFRSEALREAGVARRPEAARLTLVAGRAGAARRVVPDAVAVAVVRFAGEVPLRAVARFVEAAAFPGRVMAPL